MHRPSNKLVTLFKAMLSILFVLLIIAVIVAYNAPSTGYEQSIYSGTPEIVWWLLGIVFAGGIAIILLTFYGEIFKYIQIRKCGIFLVYMAYAVCLALTIIRNYYMWNMGGDPASHIGSIKNIILYGHFDLNNFYPITHILTAQLINISGVDIIILHKLLPLIFGLISPPCYYLLAKKMFKDGRIAIIVALLSMTFFHHWYLDFTPNHLSNLFFPLFIFIFYSSVTRSSIQWHILAIIMVLLLPVFHPVPAFAMIIIIFSFWLYSILKTHESKVKKKELVGSEKLKYRVYSPLLLLSIVWSITWITSFYVWERTIKNIYILISEGAQTNLSRLTGQMDYAQFFGYDIIEYGFRMYGSFILLWILATVAIIIAYKYDAIFLEKSIPFLISMLLIIFVIFVLLISNVGFSPLRFLIYVTMILILLAGYLIYHFLKRAIDKPSLKRISVICLTFVLICMLLIMGARCLYPSKYILEYNFQTTEYEVYGFQWTLYDMESNFELSGISVAPGRLASILVDPSDRNAIKLPTYFEGSFMPPYHFGYDQNNTLAVSYLKNTYLVLSERDKQLYTTIFSKMESWRWNTTDFLHLNYDCNLNKIYSNGEFDTWLITVNGGY